MKVGYAACEGGVGVDRARDVAVCAAVGFGSVEHVAQYLGEEHCHGCLDGMGGDRRGAVERCALAQCMYASRGAYVRRYEYAGERLYVAGAYYGVPPGADAEVEQSVSAGQYADYVSVVLVLCGADYYAFRFFVHHGCLYVIAWRARRLPCVSSRRVRRGLCPPVRRDGVCRG